MASGAEQLASSFNFGAISKAAELKNVYGSRWVPNRLPAWYIYSHP